MVWQYPLAIGVGYLAGSIPFGWIAGKVTRGIDVRNYGSGATGATNVLRTLGMRSFLLVLVADALKGYVPVLATWYIAEPHVGSDTAHGLQVAAGAAAIVGHDWPLYIGWRGGKGVATSYGAMAGLLFPALPGYNRAGSARSCPIQARGLDCWNGTTPTAATYRGDVQATRMPSGSAR